MNALSIHIISVVIQNISVTNTKHYHIEFRLWSPTTFVGFTALPNRKLFFFKWSQSITNCFIVCRWSTIQLGKSFIIFLQTRWFYKIRFFLTDVISMFLPRDKLNFKSAVGEYLLFYLKVNWSEGPHDPIVWYINFTFGNSLKIFISLSW